MVNILDEYIQISFNKTDEVFKYSGTSNIKNTKVKAIDVAMYSLEGNYHIGNMNLKEDSGISISLVNSGSINELVRFSNKLKDIKAELEDYVLNK